MLKVGTVEKYQKEGGTTTLPKEVRAKIQEVLQIYDDNYGVDRDIDKDLGGYIVVTETQEDWQMVKQVLDVTMYEFAEEIFNTEYVYILYIVSSDYAIGVISKSSLIDLALDFEL